MKEVLPPSAEIEEQIDQLLAVGVGETPRFPGRLVPFTTGLHVTICARQRVPVVWFHWDLPPRRWIERLHRAGTRIWMQVGSVDDAGPRNRARR